MSVRKSVAWAYVGQLLTFAVTFAGSVIVARLLTPPEMGVFAVSVAASGALQVITAFGVNAYVVREADLRPGLMDTAFTVNAILALLLALALVGLSFPAETLLGHRGAGHVLQVLALGPIIGILTFRQVAMLQREMRFRQLALISIASAVVGTTTTVTFAMFGASYMSLAYGSLASSLSSLILFHLVALQHTSFRVSLRDWRPIVVFGARIMSISGVAVLGARLSEIVLGRVLGLSALGLYSRASGLANNIFDNLYGTATRVVFAQLAKESREGLDIKPTFLHGFKLITAMMWPLLIGLAVLARPVIYTLYGEKWLGAALPLSLLMIAQFLTLCFGMNWELFVLRDETKKQTQLEFMRTMVGFVFFVIGCQFSLAGAAAGRIMDSLFGLAVYLPHMSRLTGSAPAELMRIYFQSGAATLGAVTPSLVLMIAFNWSPQTPPLFILMTIVAGIALWLTILKLFGHPLFAELKQLPQRIIARRS